MLHRLIESPLSELRCAWTRCNECLAYLDVGNASRPYLCCCGENFHYGETYILAHQLETRLISDGVHLVAHGNDFSTAASQLSGLTTLHIHGRNVRVAVACPEPLAESAGSVGTRQHIGRGQGPGQAHQTRQEVDELQYVRRELRKLSTCAGLLV